MPLCTGVPEIVPVVPFKLRPGGSVPQIVENWYGFDPPLTDTTVLYGVCVVAFGMFPETVMWEPLTSVVGDDEDFPVPAEGAVALWAGKPHEVIKRANRKR